jgi:hypothetical protein
MNCKRSEPSPGSTDEIGPVDIFSQVMGPERSGRLQICGGGVVIGVKFQLVVLNTLSWLSKGKK